jgi:hypothetical protein
MALRSGSPSVESIPANFCQSIYRQRSINRPRSNSITQDLEKIEEVPVPGAPFVNSFANGCGKQKSLENDNSVTLVNEKLKKNEITLNVEALGLKK